MLINKGCLLRYTDNNKNNKHEFLHELRQINNGDASGFLPTASPCIITIFLTMCSCILTRLSAFMFIDILLTYSILHDKKEKNSLLRKFFSIIAGRITTDVVKYFIESLLRIETTFERHSFNGLFGEHELLLRFDYTTIM